jgi:hypothetical protein
MKYRALSNGTIGKGASVRRVRTGEIFDLPEGNAPGKWMEKVVETVVEEAPKKKGKAKADPSGETATEPTDSLV